MTAITVKFDRWSAIPAIAAPGCIVARLCVLGGLAVNLPPEATHEPPEATREPLEATVRSSR